MNGVLDKGNVSRSERSAGKTNGDEPPRGLSVKGYRVLEIGERSYPVKGGMAPRSPLRRPDRF